MERRRGRSRSFLHPAVIDVSAWWGQYESIYLLSALIAVLLAVSGRNGLAAAALAVALMTKPQALPFLVPFAAWFLGAGGLRGFIRAARIGAAVDRRAVAALHRRRRAGDYLRNLAEYQGDIFTSCRCAPGTSGGSSRTVRGRSARRPTTRRFIGPITFRGVGLPDRPARAGVLVSVLRDPRPRTLSSVCAAATLVAFMFLTTMHERYAYGSARLPDVPGPGATGPLARGSRSASCSR